MSAMAAAKMRHGMGGGGASGRLRAPLFVPCGLLTFPWPFFGGYGAKPPLYGCILWVSKIAALLEAWQRGDVACRDLTLWLLGPTCQ